MGRTLRGADPDGARDLMPASTTVPLSAADPPIDDMPTVSIGLPVYNGEPYLEQALTSLLGQTYSDFELIISDNGSTDGTEEISRRFAKADRRVRYIRHPENRGLVFNWNYVVSEARGNYFKWASANDYCDHCLLEQCVEALQTRSDAVLCYVRTNLIGESGRPLGVDGDDFELLDEEPETRFLRMMGHAGRNNAVAGLIRMAALKKTRLIRDYPHGDRVFMAELALLGKFWLIDKPLFFRRYDSQSSSVRAMPTDELRAFLAPQKRSDRRLDLWSRQLDFLYASLRAPLPLMNRLRLMAAVLRRTWWQRGRLSQEIYNHVWRHSR